jgi:adenylate cyclase
LLQHLSSGELLLNPPAPGDGVVGLVSLPEGPMLVASRSILTSEGEGPVRGHLIFGRYLDAEGVEKLSRTTLISLDAIPVATTQMMPEHRDVLAELSLESPILVQPLSADVVAGYALVPDIYGEPALLLEAEMARGVYQRGQATLLYFTIALIAIGLIFGVVILVLLEKLVLSRLARLTGEVNAIGSSAGSSARMSISGKDELSQLGNEINAMLYALEKSQDELRNRVPCRSI